MNEFVDSSVVNEQLEKVLIFIGSLVSISSLLFSLSNIMFNLQADGCCGDDESARDYVMSEIKSAPLMHMIISFMASECESEDNSTLHVVQECAVTVMTILEQVSDSTKLLVERKQFSLMTKVSQKIMRVQGKLRFSIF